MEGSTSAQHFFLPYWMLMTNNYMTLKSGLRVNCGKNKLALLASLAE